MIGEIICCQRRMLHGMEQVVCTLRDNVVEFIFAILGDQCTLADDRFHLEGARLIDEQDISIFARCD